MKTTETITVLQNAHDSLEHMTHALEAGAEDLMHLKEALAWGWHASGLLMYKHLRSISADFDQWMQEYLDEGEQPLDVERDARWTEDQRLSFLELLDLLSETKLPLLEPQFYKGWRDKTIRCHTLREEVARLVGGSINAEQRHHLLLLLAVYHRLIRQPGNVMVDVGATLTAFPALLDMIELLLSRIAIEGESLMDIVARSRATLQVNSG